MIFEAADEPRGDGPDDFVLDRKDIPIPVIVALGPELSAARRFNELGMDAKPVAEGSHASPDDVLDAQLARHLIDRRTAGPKEKRRIPRDHHQRTKP